MPEALELIASVVIPSRDRLDLIRVAADGVLNGTDYPAIELVIVDNGSTDGTAELIRHWAAEEHDAERFPVQIVDGGSVPGIPAARTLTFTAGWLAQIAIIASILRWI